MSIIARHEARCAHIDRCDGCHKEGAPFEDTSTGGVYCSETCGRRHHPAATPAFTAIAREAVRVGWPTSYRRDLTLWDRLALQERAAMLDAGMPCLWFLRECGTHLVFPAGLPADPVTERGWNMPAVAASTLVDAVIGTWGATRGDPCRVRCYAWSNGRLREVSCDEARALADRWEREAAKAREAA